MLRSFVVGKDEGRERAPYIPPTVPSNGITLTPASTALVAWGDPGIWLTTVQCILAQPIRGKCGGHLYLYSQRPPHTHTIGRYNVGRMDM